MAISIKISTNGASQSVDRSIKDARNYISSNYNWNGIVKLMHDVYHKYGEVYKLSDQLSGTEKDDLRLFPDKAIGFIMDLQMHLSLNKKRAQQ